MEGINSQSIPFAYDDFSTNVLDSEFEYEDQEEPYIDIENEDRVDPYQNPSPTLNTRPKWDQKFI